uniref:Uncharacterized protein n=1 Tax=Arundo donax TaxID=35708 RepID=A0A0A9C3K0_ARUDO
MQLGPWKPLCSPEAPLLPRIRRLCRRRSRSKKKTAHCTQDRRSSYRPEALNGADSKSTRKARTRSLSNPLSPATVRRGDFEGRGGRRHPGTLTGGTADLPRLRRPFRPRRWRRPRFSVRFRRVRSRFLGVRVPSAAARRSCCRRLGNKSLRPLLCLGGVSSGTVEGSVREELAGSGAVASVPCSSCTGVLLWPSLAMWRFVLGDGDGDEGFGSASSRQ